MDYSAGGDFLTSCITCDSNCDGVVNTFDIDPFVLALTDTEAYELAYPHCDLICNNDADQDGTVNLFDVDPFVACLTRGGPERDDPPPTGTFGLHGRPLDVLPDGKVLMYFRARYYDPQHARWLQRDPTGHADGNDLYEAFGSNALSRTDPFGRQSGPVDYPTTDTLWSRFTGWLGRKTSTPERRVEEAQRSVELAEQAATGDATERMAAEQALREREDQQRFDRMMDWSIETIGQETIVVGGVVHTVQGVVEMGTGVYLVIVADPAGKVFGIVLIAHGYDTIQAGLIQARTGRVTETQTYTFTESLAGPKVARCVDTGIPIITVIGAETASMLRASSAFELSSLRGGISIGESGELLGPKNVTRMNFNQYEVVSEVRISGTTRSAHRAAANRNLVLQLEGSPQLQGQLNEIFGQDVLQHMNSGAGRNLLNPPGGVWHHPIDNPSVMQLLRQGEHANPLLQPILHPGNVPTS